MEERNQETVTTILLETGKFSILLDHTLHVISFSLQIDFLCKSHQPPFPRAFTKLFKQLIYFVKLFHLFAKVVY